MMSWSDNWIWGGAIQVALFWAGVIVLVVRMIRQPSERKRSANRHADAWTTARERHVRGEISDEEFEEILQGQPGMPDSE